MTEVYSNFLKICERQCSITRFVLDPDALIYIDKATNGAAKKDL